MSSLRLSSIATAVMVLVLPLLAQSVAAAQAASTVPVRVAAVKCGGGPTQKWRHIQPTPARNKCLAEHEALVREVTGDDALPTSPNPSRDRAAAVEARGPAEK